MLSATHKKHFMHVKKKTKKQNDKSFRDHVGYFNHFLILITANEPLGVNIVYTECNLTLFKNCYDGGSRDLNVPAFQMITLTFAVSSASSSRDCI